MWVDYTIYLTTGLVLLAGIALIVVVARKRAGVGTVITLVLILVVGLVGMVLVRPERGREPGQELLIVERDGSHQTEEVEGLIGQCLSLFRQIGPLWLIVGNDVVPGDDWERGPSNSCESVGLMDAEINLPDSVRSGEWMLCDHNTCFALAREA
ncbi:MAG TPA: hypothetical protein VE027_08925 [Acidimicrobiia bacterium]|nr:hypothetical protein [Acidimicrobiia bacterium]